MAVNPKPTLRLGARSASVAPATAQTVLAGAPREFVAEVGKSVRLAFSRFANAIPGGAQSSGYFVPPETQMWQCVVPDGKYRVAGADWIVVIVDNRIAEICRAVPPDYGGPDVIAV